MVTPVRMLMAHTGFVDTSSWTEVHIGRPDGTPGWAVYAGTTVSFYKAVVAEGRSCVAVDWGDGTGLEYHAPGEGREVSLSHTYTARQSNGYVVRISNDLSEFYVSHAEFYGDDVNGVRGNAMAPGYKAPFEGARRVSNVVSLGGRVANRTLSIGLFANTDVYCMPEPYGFPSLTPLANTPCVPALCFLKCSRLSAVRALTDVQVIDASAFEECIELRDISAFDGRWLNHVGPRAFYGCTHLTSLAGLSGTLTVNRDTAFFGKALTAFTGADIATASEALGVASSPKFARFRICYFNFPLGAQAFYGCTSLTDITALRFSGGVILPDTFSECSALTGVPNAVASCSFCQYYHNINMDDAWVFGSPTTRVLNSSDYYSCRYAGYYERGTSSLFAGEVWAFFRGCSRMASEPPGPHSQSGAQLVSTGEFERMSALAATITLPSSIQRIGASAFSGSNVALLVLQGKTKAQAQAMKGVRGLCFQGYDVTTYPFGLKSGAVVRCTDGDLTV